MRFSTLLSVFFLALARQGLCQNGTFDGLAKVYHESSLLRAQNNPFRRDGQPACTEDNIRVRRSWVNLTLDERAEYIAAVKCLYETPPLSPKSFAPGARHHADDFSACHYNQTEYIHFSGWLIPWHRYFVWSYESSLRDFCGYTGALPYWDWTEQYESHTQHPLFDGSDYSLGGNGEYVPHEPQNLTIPVPSRPQVLFPAGSGGGCITDGPFVNVTSNLGPHFPVQETTGLEYNPHCLKRDFVEALSQQFLTTASIENLMSQKSIGDFRQVLDIGIHFAGHGTVLGGMSDLWVSPEDPVFFFHHGQLDRLWSIWQEQDLASRMNQTSDTQTWDNVPASPNVTVFDILDYGVIGDGRVQMVDIVDTMGGFLCYRYE
ncbi:unnamed protein product [Clonostachys solani]|uniref:Tyrosinase copper-binding domain-containing protein n=1 Tax=Clonostachys solani TaxID=160281 RepID=A0A9N9W1M7_9HYPO|nr:unnamed protein product [Clonostachys solani]